MKCTVFIFLLLFPLLPFVSYTQQEQEQELLELINYCRTNPDDFSQKVALPYIKEKGLTHLKEGKSLIRTLLKIAPLLPLRMTDDLNQMAEEYALEMGRKGFTGHRSFTSRFKNNNVKYDFTGENCSYGYNSALDIIMQLLIDEGIPDYGHRKNLLSKDFQYTGISIQPHKKSEWTCVIEFGGMLGD